MSSAQPYLVKGCDKPYENQDVFPRLEIHGLMKNAYQFSLFIQAMTNLQAEGYTPDAASWKELGGIHGVPYARWSGDPAGPQLPEEKQWAGYCYHDCVLFPTWHRVVLMLVEQAIWDEAQAIVSKYSYVSAKEQEEWKKAALTLRFPYWDWAAPQVETEGMPKVLSYETLRILGPGGSTLRVRNPLRSYRFEAPPDDAPPSNYKGELRVYFDEWKRTYRWATGKNDPQEDYMQLDTILKNGTKLTVQKTTDGGETVNFDSIQANREKLVRVFSFPAEMEDKKYNPACWEHFATTDHKSPLPEKADKYTTSLEAPHNSLHTDIGGSGNMAYLEVAGFDPIFYLHHCQIDRLYAFWEYVYPDYWMGSDGYVDDDGKKQPFKNPDGTYESKAGGAVDCTTSLTPFRKADGQYWTSDNVRGLGPNAYKKYYTYEPLTVTWETNDDRGPLTHTVTIDVSSKAATLEQRYKYIAALHQYFGGSQIWSSNSALEARPPIFKSHIPSTTHTPIKGVRDFVVVATLPQFAFRGSHRLELYFDEVYVGDVSVFSRLEPEKCAKCVNNMGEGGHVVRGVVGLPNDLVLHVLEKEGANTDSTSANAVFEAIRKNLVGRVMRANRTLLAHAHHNFGLEDPGNETNWLTYSTASHLNDSLVKLDSPMPIPHDRFPVLKDTQSPTLQVYSARVLVSPDGSRPPVRKDWIDHGSIFDKDWRRWTPDTQSE